MCCTGRGQGAGGVLNKHACPTCTQILTVTASPDSLAKVRSHAQLWSKELRPAEWDYFPFNSLRGYHPTLLRTAHCVHEPPMGRCCLSMVLKRTLPSDLVSADGIVLKHQGKGFRDSKRLRWKPLYLKSRGWLKNLFLQADGSVDANFAVWNSIAYEHIGNICKHVSSCLWLCISRANSISGCDHTSRMWDHKLTTLEGVWVSSRVEVLSEKATVGKYVKCRKARQNRSLMAVWWDSGSR